MKRNKLLSIICLCISSISILLSTITLIDLNISNKPKIIFAKGYKDQVSVLNKEQEEVYNSCWYNTYIYDFKDYFSITTFKGSSNTTQAYPKNYYRYEIKPY